MEQSDPRAVLQRLIQERREDYAGLSRLLGRNAAYVQQFIKRGSPRKLAEEDRRTLAKYFGIDEGMLGGSAEGLKPSAVIEGLVPIPRLELGASAGHGAFDGQEEPIAYMGFDARWLKQLCGAKAESLSIISVQGDSMFPTLAAGDDIMVDRSDAGTRLRDGVYVLRHEDTLLVKRLSLNPATKRVTVSSDNSAYPTWPDCRPKAIDIVGRVVWAGRKLA